MENLQTYVKPELLILIPVLYIIGAIIKNTSLIKDKFIPLILGVAGILLCTLYIVATEGFTAMGVFTAVTQGILVAGVSVYTDQLIKQTSSKE